MASDLGDNRLRNRDDERLKTPGRSRLRSATIALAQKSSDGCERGDRSSDGVPVWACRAEASRLPDDPENGVGRLTQVRDESTTSVDARVPGSGCAKLRKTGAQTSPAPAQTGAKAAPGRPLPTGTAPESLPPRRQVDGLFRGEPEDRVGRLTQVQDETITSVAARVSGSGCAKKRKTGAQTPPAPAQTGAKAAPGRSLPTGTELGLLPARGRAVGLFRGEPEDRVGRLTQIQDETITSVAARVSGLGCAKMRKTGAQTPPAPAQTGAKAAAASLVSPAPEVLLRAQAPVEHDPLLSVIQKYQKEFDDQLRE